MSDIDSHQWQLILLLLLTCQCKPQKAEFCYYASDDQMLSGRMLHTK